MRALLAVTRLDINQPFEHALLLVREPTLGFLLIMVPMPRGKGL
jgi:hypothetical protein